MRELLPNMDEILSNYTMYTSVTSAAGDLATSDSVIVQPETGRNSTAFLGDEHEPLILLWTLIDGLLMVLIVGGNTLTILAVTLSRRLSNLISNKFVLNLAISDLSVGLTLPYHLAFYLNDNLGSMKTTCVLRFILITLACCASILNLIGIAIDRYVAILHPLHYSRYMSKIATSTIMGVGWMTAVGVSVVPIFWNNWGMADSCDMHKVIPKEYTTTVLAPMFSIIWMLLLIIYWRIWREASMHTKRMRTTTCLPANGPNDWKSIQVVLMVLGSFSVCWMPYVAVICAQAVTTSIENPSLYKAVFSLAMANSGVNPIIYAWKNTGFRKAFLRLLKCRSPDCPEFDRGFRTNTTHPSSERKHALESLSRRATIENTGPRIQETNLAQNPENKEMVLNNEGVGCGDKGVVTNNNGDTSKDDRCRIIENIGYHEEAAKDRRECHIIENLGFDDSLDINNLKMIDSNSKESDLGSVATLPISPADNHKYFM